VPRPGGGEDRSGGIDAVLVESGLVSILRSLTDDASDSVDAVCCGVPLLPVSAWMPMLPILMAMFLMNHRELAPARINKGYGHSPKAGGMMQGIVDRDAQQCAAWLNNLVDQAADAGLQRRGVVRVRVGMVRVIGILVISLIVVAGFMRARAYSRPRLAVDGRDADGADR
jgi:hypothetical protein